MSGETMAFTQIWLLVYVIVVGGGVSVWWAVDTFAARRRARAARLDASISRHPASRSYARVAPPNASAAGSASVYRPRGFSTSPAGHAALTAYAGRHRRGA